MIFLFGGKLCRIYDNSKVSIMQINHHYVDQGSNTHYLKLLLKINSISEVTVLIDIIIKMI